MTKEIQSLNNKGITDVNAMLLQSDLQVSRTGIPYLKGKFGTYKLDSISKRITDISLNQDLTLEDRHCGLKAVQQARKFYIEADKSFCACIRKIFEKIVSLFLVPVHAYQKLSDPKKYFDSILPLAQRFTPRDSIEARPMIEPPKTITFSATSAEDNFRQVNDSEYLVN